MHVRIITVVVLVLLYEYTVKDTPDGQREWARNQDIFRSVRDTPTPFDVWKLEWDRVSIAVSLGAATLMGQVKEVAVQEDRRTPRRYMLFVHSYTPDQHLLQLQLHHLRHHQQELQLQHQREHQRCIFI